MKIRLQGWKAAAALIVVAAVWLGWRVHVSSSLDTQAVEALKPWIRAECARAVLKETESKPLDEMSAAEAEEFGRRLVASHNVEVKIDGMHGSGGEYVIRAEVKVDGRPPPDGKTLRYYKMKYSALTGWSYVRDSDAVSYWLKLF